TSARSPANAKAIVSAPPLSMARRETWEGFARNVISASLTRGVHHRADDARMRAAAAQVAVKRCPHVLFAGRWFLAKECRRAHDHAARAVAALRHLLFDEGGLDGMRRRARTEPLERGHRFALHIGNRSKAGRRRPTVDPHHTGAALA